ncbi:hypothetical protein QVD17_19613 [Tagetes erecta]|uniref:Uncharacterized protein n=1 Tax=Tagetes erecta TaxID=13708 RepID=A0AAD8KK40_TARER|nr:hypothetical protein QVD17_19613 [Tagetes erecta]
MNLGHDANVSGKGNKDKEVALMAQSEEIKVESSSSESEKPTNDVPLPETVKEKLCSPYCAEQIEHYRSYSFKIYENLSKEEKRHNKLKEDHKTSTEMILSIQKSWKKSLEEIESLKHQLSELSKNFKNEKIAHALTQVELSKVTSCKTMVQQLEFLRKKFGDEHQEEESEVEVFIELDQSKIKNGHPVKIKSYHPRKRTMQVYIAKGCREISTVSSKHEDRLLGLFPS